MRAKTRTGNERTQMGIEREFSHSSPLLFFASSPPRLSLERRRTVCCAVFRGALHQHEYTKTVVNEADNAPKAKRDAKGPWQKANHEKCRRGPAKGTQQVRSDFSRKSALRAYLIRFSTDITNRSRRAKDDSAATTFECCVLAPTHRAKAASLRGLRSAGGTPRATWRRERRR